MGSSTASTSCGCYCSGKRALSATLCFTIAGCPCLLEGLSGLSIACTILTSYAWHPRSLVHCLCMHHGLREIKECKCESLQAPQGGKGSRACAHIVSAICNSFSLGENPRNLPCEPRREPTEVNFEAYLVVFVPSLSCQGL